MRDRERAAASARPLFWVFSLSLQAPVDDVDTAREDDRAQAALRLRFRLLGASALLLLAVVLLPWIFDGAGWAEITGDEVEPSAPPVFPAPEFAQPPTEAPVLPEWTAQAGREAPSLDAVAPAPVEPDATDRRGHDAPVSGLEPDARAGQTPPDRAPNAATGPPRTREALAASASVAGRADPVASAPNRAPVQSPVASSREPVAAPGEGWIVQLGSFRDTANAEVLARRVQGFGFQAYVEAPDSATGLHRVRIGPYRERSAAEAVRERLARQHNVESIVVPISR